MNIRNVIPRRGDLPIYLPVLAVLIAIWASQVFFNTRWSEPIHLATVAAVSAVIIILAHLLTLTLRKHVAAMADVYLREQALEVMTQGITITDRRIPGGPIMYANPAYNRIMQLSKEEVVGRSAISLYDAETAQQLIAKATEAMRIGVPKFEVEFAVKRKDGSKVLVHHSGAPIVGTTGEVTHGVALYDDITESRRRDELLMEAQKMESVGQLTGGIAHDFNNLLTAVKSCAEDLRDDLSEDAYHKEMASIIVEAADRGAVLVAQLMAFARKQELQPQTLDVNQFLDLPVKMIRSALPANITVNVKKGDGTHRVHVDPARLKTALLNIVFNARDAMPDGGTLTIETWCKMVDAGYASANLDVRPGPYILIAISDTGTGMPAHVVERAFTPFFTTKEVGKGTGLGLSLVHGFVKQSGGSAKIYSEVGHGTIVRVYLPAQEGSAPAQSAEADIVEAKAASATTILMVEDDPVMRLTISNKLTALGYQIVTAPNAQEALEILERNAHFDLVFSDIVMPGTMNGADLVREVMARWPTIRVLLTSGYTESAILGRINIPPGVSLLSKPCSNEELIQAVARALWGTSQAGA